MTVMANDKREVREEIEELTFFFVFSVLFHTGNALKWKQNTENCLHDWRGDETQFVCPMRVCDLLPARDDYFLCKCVLYWLSQYKVKRTVCLKVLFEAVFESS